MIPDHIACLPLTMIGEECGNHIFNIYAPLSSHTYIHNYIKAMFDVNSMGDVNISPWYMFKGLIKHDTVALDANKTKLLVEVFECDHKIPTVSYGFSEIKSKLKDEYKSFSGKEIVQLKKQGAVITEDVTSNKLAYVCDTSISILENHPEILNYKVVMIECTFILPEELPNAIATQHIHWSQLKPYILQHPEINFILFHFSMRYRDHEISTFFEREDISNVQWW